MTAASASAAEAGDIQARARGARTASRKLAITSTEVRNAALDAVAERLQAERERILEANRLDMTVAAEMVDKGDLAEPLLKRLDLSGPKFDSVIEMVRSVRLAGRPSRRDPAHDRAR